MAYFIKEKTTYTTEIDGVTVRVKQADHGPFDSIEAAVTYWHSYNGGRAVGFYSEIDVYEVSNEAS